MRRIFMPRRRRRTARGTGGYAPAAMGWTRRADTSDLVTTLSNEQLASANRMDEYEAPDWVKHTLHQGIPSDAVPRRRIDYRSLTDRLLSHPGRLSVCYFMTLIIVVMLLLLLPASSRGYGVTSPHIAFFTAVSALSTCGIPVVNTALHWTMFGQAIILIAVQLGGLGVMTFASMITLGVSRRLKVSQRLLTATELGATKLSEVRGIIAVVLTSTFVIETVTFVSLFPGLYRNNGGAFWWTVWQSLFYAVSAYNNTGFTPDATGFHVSDWNVGLPILVSAFIGTIGFPVILNVFRTTVHRRSPRRWSLHTKLTLLTTFLLVLLSFSWFIANEWNNPVLFPPGSTDSSKFSKAISAAVMPRSAGFDISWVPMVSEQTKVFMSGMMFIGTGSSSTGGGIRVTTFAVLLLICRAAFANRRDITVFHRRIPRQVRLMAVSIAVTCLTLVYFAAIALIIITGCDFGDAIFEASSAFSLGGYSVGVASVQQPASLYVLAFLMIVGRLGPMTIAYSISKPRPASVVRYPEESIVVG
nr:potassium transporter TrkG [Bifidobacterium sp. DSM 109958]